MLLLLVPVKDIILIGEHIKSSNGYDMGPFNRSTCAGQDSTVNGYNRGVSRDL